MNIETKRCQLNLVESAHFLKLTEIFTNPLTRKYLGGTITRQAALKRLQENSTNPEIIFCVASLTKTNQVIGLIGLHKGKHDKKAELSYQFLPQFWGNGYAHETLSAFIDFSFKTSKISKIFAETQSANLASIKLLENLGMTLCKKVVRYEAEQSIFTIFNRNSV